MTTNIYHPSPPYLLLEGKQEFYLYKAWYD